jgi:hypothetical protein
MAMLGGFVAVVFHRLKHFDDLNMTRKKDAALEYIKFSSEYRSTLLTLIDPSINSETFHSNLFVATKNMLSSLDKFHVVSNDTVSKNVELKNTEIVELMIKFRSKAEEYGNDKLSLFRWFISQDIGVKLNLNRFELIKMINSEVGDKSGTDGLKEAIYSNNAHFKTLFSKLLK